MTQKSFLPSVAPLQLLGRIAAGRFTSGRVCLGTGVFLWPQEAIPPRFYPLRRGWVYCLAPEAPLIRVMPTGPNVFLAMPDAYRLQPCNRPPLKTALCHICMLVGRMINNQMSFLPSASPLQLLVCIAAGRFTSVRFCRVCLGTGEFLWPQGAIPSGFYPLQGGWVYCLAPLIRGMPTEPKVFLVMLDAFGL